MSNPKQPARKRRKPDPNAQTSETKTESGDRELSAAEAAALRKALKEHDEHQRALQRNRQRISEWLERKSKPVDSLPILTRQNVRPSSAPATVPVSGTPSVAT